MACAVLLSGCDKLGLGDKNPAAPSGPPSTGTPIVYSAVGASDVFGFGSSSPCLPFEDCPNGTGYVAVAARTLRSQGFTVTLRNLGLPTAVISRTFQNLGQQYGRTIAGNYIEGEMPFVLTNSTLVTIFAGPNDVNTITAALGGGAGGSSPAAYIDAQVRQFGTDFATLLSGIRGSAPSARIIVLNVPNMAGLPSLTGASLAQRQAAQRISVSMTTTVVNPLVGQGVVVVDLMCDSRTYIASNYFSDGLHPNDSGYQYMASEMTRAITSSSYPAPQSTCGSMTIVPNP